MFHFDEFLKSLNETFWMIFKHGEEVSIDYSICRSLKKLWKIRYLDDEYGEQSHHDSSSCLWSLTKFGCRVDIIRHPIIF